MISFPGPTWRALGLCNNRAAQKGSCFVLVEGLVGWVERLLPEHEVLSLNFQQHSHAQA